MYWVSTYAFRSGFLNEILGNPTLFWLLNVRDIWFYIWCRKTVQKESDGSAGGSFDEVCIWQNIGEVCQSKLLLKWEPLGVINSSGSSWWAIFDIKYFPILPCDILLCWKPKLSINLFHFTQTDPAQPWMQVGLCWCYLLVFFFFFCSYMYFAVCTWESSFGRKTSVLIYLVEFL